MHTALPGATRVIGGDDPKLLGGIYTPHPPQDLRPWVCHLLRGDPLPFAIAANGDAVVIIRLFSHCIEELGRCPALLLSGFTSKIGECGHGNLESRDLR